MTTQDMHSLELEDMFAALMAESDGKKGVKDNEITRGRILEIRKDQVVVDIGYKSEGVIDIREFSVEDGELSIKVGDYIGQNYGRIVKVDETQIVLREIVQDAAGEWIERPATLQLQEQAR